MPAGTTPESLTADLLQDSDDLRAVVLLDAAGSLIASTEPDRDVALRIAELVAQLVEAADEAAPGPVEQLEAYVERGGVFATRTARHTLASVAKRLALPSLVLYDQRRALARLEGTV